MIEPNLVAQVVAAVRKVARIPREIPITAETRMVDDLRIDSLDLFAVVLEVQDRFDIVFEVEDLPRINRVGDLAAYVAGQREATAA
jgi:acyl carrier protein